MPTPRQTLTPLPLILGGLVMALASLTGCGDGGGGERPARTVKEPDLAASGAVTGRAVFEGKPPRRQPLQMGGDAVCGKINEGETLDERVVVGEDGGLRDVFVHVSRGLEDYTFAYADDVVEVDQKGCVFVPHVTGVRAWQDVEFRNSDPTVHNVKTADFNRSVNPDGGSFTWRFSRVGLDRQVSCTVHPWMLAYIHVVDHPYFAVSAEDGSFSLPRRLPPGTYTIEAVHPRLGKQTQEITVEDGATVNVAFTFKR